VDRDEEIGRESVCDGDTLAQRERAVVGARHHDANFPRAEAFGDEVRDREGELLLVESCALRAAIRTAVPGIEDDDTRTGVCCGGQRDCRQERSSEHDM